MIRICALAFALSGTCALDRPTLQADLDRDVAFVEHYLITKYVEPRITDCMSFDEDKDQKILVCWKRAQNEPSLRIYTALHIPSIATQGPRTCMAEFRYERRPRLFQPRISCMPHTERAERYSTSVQMTLGEISREEQLRAFSHLIAHVADRLGRTR